MLSVMGHFSYYIHAEKTHSIPIKLDEMFVVGLCTLYGLGNPMIMYLMIMKGIINMSQGVAQSSYNLLVRCTHVLGTLTPGNLSEAKKRES